MGGTFQAGRLIHLPRLNASSGVTLGAQLLTAAETLPLPEGARTQLEALRRAHRALQGVLAQELPHPVDARRARRADIAEDAAWSSIASWLEGWMGLLGTAQAARAKRIYHALFPDGLRFTQLPYKLEWAEADAKLGLIQREALEAEFAALGGTPFLDGLRAVHAEYADALGFGEQGPSPIAAELRVVLDDLIAALRSYVFSVVAHAEESGDPARADRLLAPLVRWEILSLRGQREDLDALANSNPPPSRNG